MFQRLITKYGLAVHLGVLAAGSFILPIFFPVPTVSVAMLWFGLFGLIWLLCEPSLRVGERTIDARYRIRGELVRDPLFYFLSFMLAVSAVRWLNSGISQFYDAEIGKWQLQRTGSLLFPCTVDGLGGLWFSVTLAVFVTLMGLRHALGRGARIFFGLTCGVLAAVAGVAALVMIALGNVGFIKMASIGFANPSCGFAFGTIFLILVGSGADAEASNWRYARIPYLFAVAGTAIGMALFSPAIVSAGFLGLSILLFLFGLAFVWKNASIGCLAQNLVLFALGLVAAGVALAIYLPVSVLDAKLAALDWSVALPESYFTINEALAGLAKSMWMGNPWIGVGIGGFQLSLPYTATPEDWMVIPAVPVPAANGYWMMLVERGMLGCISIAVGIIMLVVFWVLRLIAAIRHHKSDADTETLIFAASPFAWAAIPLLLLQSAVVWLSPISTLPSFLVMTMMPLALAASSFPKAPAKTNG